MFSLNEHNNLQSGFFLPFFCFFGMPPSQFIFLNPKERNFHSSNSQASNCIHYTPNQLFCYTKSLPQFDINLYFLLSPISFPQAPSSDYAPRLSISIGWVPYFCSIFVTSWWHSLHLHPVKSHLGFKVQFKWCIDLETRMIVSLL
jgi:hypothetical protein